ncbi:winged helix-turn-helix domain-containing protein [Sphingomonas sp.]|uniref:helix-turn-helix domain-containing protein n=1 Tax=Sphingomonas sp. TaxID=28214 RepID=UPI0035B0B85E
MRRPAPPAGGRPAGDVEGDRADGYRSRDRWCLDLAAGRPVRERFGVDYEENGSGKLLHRLDLSRQTPRPQHTEADLAAQERSKRGLRRLPRADRSRPPRGRPYRAAALPGEAAALPRPAPLLRLARESAGEICHG